MHHTQRMNGIFLSRLAGVARPWMCSGRRGLLHGISFSTEESACMINAIDMINRTNQKSVQAHVPSFLLVLVVGPDP